ncbi:hypothetical protein DFH07DRAFT_90540 [Mycena maculata]|uniref:Uncharacterized protein n=1 Tax=Mycena maculata TaxID=230809 RepID=A0AAD7I963_9AGAR|nr:hypothetical protein DFH07DRAFT_90540 [Mycena maculata]
MRPRCVVARKSGPVILLEPPSSTLIAMFSEIPGGGPLTVSSNPFFAFTKNLRHIQRSNFLCPTTRRTRRRIAHLPWHQAYQLLDHASYTTALYGLNTLVAASSARRGGLRALKRHVSRLRMRTGWTRKALGSRMVRQARCRTSLPPHWDRWSMSERSYGRRAGGIPDGSGTVRFSEQVDRTGRAPIGGQCWSLEVLTSRRCAAIRYLQIQVCNSDSDSERGRGACIFFFSAEMPPKERSIFPEISQLIAQNQLTALHLGGPDECSKVEYADHWRAPS